MVDGRLPLPVGTQLTMEDGAVYTITGEPVGRGGGSILYPIQKENENAPIPYALKECYPCSGMYLFEREPSGQICCREEEGEAYLQLLKARMRQEGIISRKIYRVSSRSLPIRQIGETVTLTLPGKTPKAVHNGFSIMDSQSDKGQSLSQWMESQGRFAPQEALRIVQQVLFALKEVHDAGFLHLDIQDGNVFLKGSVSDKNELVTLIDFGCAREMQDGKTAPIADRLIFTTQGFSAPEILLHNDGELQLGPEADLFSVGCLTIYLLTGQRASVAELLANRTGVFLRPNHLRRMKLPKHLADALQQMLARALAREPKERYHNAQEMLRDVTDLVEALRPYRTDLAAVKYDAFICYKHGPVDSVAALTLQRALETYRAPKRAATKRKPFGRVFLDEGELSSCADFGQQIQEALKNAGWLIVICSPDTPTSPWVQQEIDCFLKYHDRSRILAVLTVGSPETAFPPQLLGDGNGTREVFAPHALCETPREAARKLRGDALLKIIAPMLGTTYDTLKQRHRIYRWKRLTAVAAFGLVLALGFGAFALNRAQVIGAQKARIQQEYTNALIKESYFLVEQAEKRLADQDTLSAVELLLQALPSESQERPVLTEAEYLLSKALGVYTTPGSNRNTFTTAGKIETEKNNYMLDETDQYLLAWDSDQDGLEVWDTRTFTRLREISTGDTYGYKMLGIQKNTVLLNRLSDIFSVNFVTGEVVWTALKEEDAPYMSTLCSFLCYCKEGYVLRAWQEEKEDAAFLNVSIRAAADGSVWKKLTIPLPEGSYIGIPTALSEDGKWLAFSGGGDRVYLANLEEEWCSCLIDTLEYMPSQDYTERVVQTLAISDDRLAVIWTDGFALSTMEEKVVTRAVAQTDTFAELYSLETQGLLSRQCLEIFSKENGSADVEFVTYTRNGEPKKGVLFQIDEHVILEDMEDGTVVQEYSLPSELVELTPREDGWDAITADGSFCSLGYAIGFDKEALMTRRCWSRTVTQACWKDGVGYIRHNPFGIDGENTIYIYEKDRFSDGYQKIAALENVSLWQNALWNNDLVILHGYSQVSTVSREGEVEHFCLGEEEEDSRLLGLSADGNRVYLSARDYDSGEDIYYTVDLAGRKVLTCPLPDWETMGYTHMEGFGEDQLFFTEAQEDGTRKLYGWALPAGGLTEYYQTEPEQNIQYSSLQVDENCHCLSFRVEQAGETGKFVWMRLDGGERGELDLPAWAGEDVQLSWNADGSLLWLSWGKTCMALTPTGEKLATLCLDSDVAALWPLEEQELLILDENGALTWYVPDTGMQNQLMLSDYQTMLYSPYEAETWKACAMEEGCVLLLGSSEAFLLERSQDGLKMKAVIDHCIGYDRQTQQFMVADIQYADCQVGSLPVYTLEEMIDMGNRLLGKETH